MAVAKGKTKVRRDRWFEEFFLSLDPEKRYRTGDIVSEWEKDDQVVRAMQEKCKKKPKDARSVLSRYMPYRYKMFLNESSDQNPESTPTARAYQPIGTEPFGPTGHDMNIYLGAQYAWVAADYLGLEQPRSLEEVLELLKKALEIEDPKSVEGTESSYVVVEAPAESIQAVSVPGGDQTEMGQVETVKPTKRSLRKRFRRWRVPMAFAMSAFSTFICLATIGGVILFQSYPELEKMETAQNTGGVTAVKNITKSFKVSGNKAEVYGIGWRAAYDPHKDIEEIKTIIEPLLYDEELGWQAKANHVVGLAYLNRGHLSLALENFEEAETKLRGLSKQRLDLKKIYLSMADCHFYLYQPEKMMECIKLAQMLNVPGREAVTLHYESQYNFLQGDINKAITLSHKALRLSKTTETSYSGYYHANLGLLYSATGNMDQSYKHLKEAHAFAVLNQDSSLLSVIYEYERFWAEKMNFPFSGVSSINKSKSFSSEKNYISFSVDLARESSVSKPRRQ
ncbi:hypothetical protein APED_15195 [Acanthopleuribacter pedis]